MQILASSIAETSLLRCNHAAMNLGQWIVYERDRRGWGQRELANESELSLFSIQKLEKATDRPNVRAKTAAKVAEAFGTDLQRMLDAWRARVDLSGRPIPKSGPAVTQLTVTIRANQRLDVLAKEAGVSIEDVIERLAELSSRPEYRKAVIKGFQRG